jgi:hypothetical protein
MELYLHSPNTPSFSYSPPIQNFSGILSGISQMNHMDRQTWPANHSELRFYALRAATPCYICWLWSLKTCNMCWILITESLLYVLNFSLKSCYMCWILVTESLLHVLNFDHWNPVTCWIFITETLLYVLNFGHSKHVTCVEFWSLKPCNMCWILVTQTLLYVSNFCHWSPVIYVGFPSAFHDSSSLNISKSLYGIECNSFTHARAGMYHKKINSSPVQAYMYIKCDYKWCERFLLINLCNRSHNL